MKPRVTGHFIAGAAGPLAVMLWEPPRPVEQRFAVLYLPPAGDELNRSRRMVAQQARSLAAHGGAVAVLDPRGTGDSDGDHGDATWQRWKDDAVFAWDWLHAHATGPRVLWGLRLGGLLATDLVDERRIAASALLLWQPVVEGRTFFHQWLRLANAQQLTGGETAGGDSRSLRESLAAGRAVEVGGYELNSELVMQADAVGLHKLRPQCPVVWRDVVASIPAMPGAASARAATAMASGGADIDVAAVSGPPFWMTQEIEDAPALIGATTASMTSLMSRCAPVVP